MQNRPLIKKIKELQQIKPNKDWVLFTKREILGEGKEEQIVSWLFTPIRKPALVVAPLVVLAAVLGGLFVYFNFLPQSIVPIITGPSGNQEAEEIVASLEGLQVSLGEITLALNNLKKAKNPVATLGVTEVVKSTVKKGEEVVGQIKTSERAKADGVLASLTGVENALLELGQTNQDLQKETIKAQIDDLKQKSLTQEQEELLELAERYYNEGNYSEALIILAMKLK